MKWSEVAQLCPTLCDPWTVAHQASPSHGIFQAWVLERVAIAFSKGSSRPRDWTRVSGIAGGFFTSWAPRWFVRVKLELGSVSEWCAQESIAKGELLEIAWTILFFSAAGNIDQVSRWFTYTEKNVTGESYLKAINRMCGGDKSRCRIFHIYLTDKCPLWGHW